MNEKLKRPLLWIAPLLLALPFVHAAGIGDLLQPIVDLLGPGGFVEIYQYAQPLIDSILITLLFYFLFKSIPYAKNVGTGFMVILALILGIAFMYIEMETGFTLAALGPIALAILLIALIGLMVGVLNKAGVKNKLGIFLIVFFLLWSGIVQYFPAMEAYLRRFPLVWTVLSLMYALSIIFLIVWFIQWLVSNFRGPSKTAGSAGEVFSSLGSAIGAASKNVSESYKERRAANLKKKQDGNKAAVDASTLVRDKVRNDLVSQIQSSQQVDGDVQELKKYTEATTKFADDVHSSLQASANQPGFNYDVYKNNVKAQKTQLETYFSRQRAVANSVVTILDPKNPNMHGVQAQEEALKELDNLKTVEFSKDQKYLTNVAQSLEIVKAEYVAAVEQVKKANQANPGDGQRATNLVNQLRTKYEAQVQLLQSLQSEQAANRARILETKKRYDSITNLFKSVNQLKANQRQVAQRLVGKEGLLDNYQKSFMEFLNEPGSTDAHTAFAEKTSPVLGAVDLMSQYAAQIKSVETTIEQERTALEQLEAQNKQVLEAWTKAVDNLIERQRELTYTAQAVQTVAQAIITKQNMDPAVFTKLGQVPGIQVQLVGNTPGTGNHIHLSPKNAEALKKYIEDTFAVLTRDVAQAKEKLAEENAANSTNIQGDAELAEGLKHAQELRDELVQKWEADVAYSIRQPGTP
jgi:hypothetical protein